MISFIYFSIACGFSTVSSSASLLKVENRFFFVRLYYLFPKPSCCFLFDNSIFDNSAQMADCKVRWGYNSNKVVRAWHVAAACRCVSTHM